MSQVWRGWVVQDVLVPFVVTRTLLALIGWLALQSFQNLPAMPGAWEIKPNGQIGVAAPHLSTDSYPWLNPWARWDAGWYQGIAKNGYHFVPGRQSNTAFFPSYPMLMRAAHLFSPSTSDASWFICGIIVANAALLAAAVYLVLLIRLDSDTATAARGALYLFVFPTSFFFSAIYSESLFLAAALAAFYYARTHRWLLAGAFAAIATATRSPGLLLFPALALEYFAQRGFEWRRVRIDIAALALIPAALGAHMFYFHLRFGNLMAVQDAQSAWGGEWGRLASPWKPLVRLWNEPWVFNDLINFAATAFLLVAAIMAALRLRASYAAYAIMCYCFVTAWGTLESMPRYILMAFPIFILLAMAGRNEIFHRAYLYLGGSIGVFLIMRFSLWRWVA